MESGSKRLVVARAVLLIQRHANREPAILLGHVLMDGVVGETRERAEMRAEERLDVGHPQRLSGLLYGAEQLAAFLLRQHGAQRSTGIRGSHFDVAEARGAGAVAGAHDLLGLALAAIRNAPQHPVVAIGDGRAGIPELGGDAAVGRVLAACERACRP